MTTKTNRVHKNETLDNFWSFVARTAAELKLQDHLQASIADKPPEITISDWLNHWQKGRVLGQPEKLAAKTANTSTALARPSPYDQWWPVDTNHSIRYTIDQVEDAVPPALLLSLRINPRDRTLIKRIYTDGALVIIGREPTSLLFRKVNFDQDGKAKLVYILPAGEHHDDYAWQIMTHLRVQLKGL